MHLARGVFAIAILTIAPASAFAVEQAPEAPPAPEAPRAEAPPAPEGPDAAAAAPPPLPYKKGLVLDSSLGAHGFAGEFGRVAPPGFWLHTQLGYEFFRWLMLFGEADLYFTDSSRSQDPTKSRAFPIFGFGLGPRITARISGRVGLYAQGSLGFMKADIANNALKILGFENAESFGLYIGGRIGIEWYQLDRHLALGLSAGVRDATNFKKTIGSDLPLLWDAGVALRYAF